MTSPQHFDVAHTTSYCTVRSPYGYVDVDGRPDVTREAQECPLYDLVGACSPTTAAAIRQDLMDIEEELSSNYLSLGMASTSSSPVLAGMAPTSGSMALSSGFAAGNSFLTQEDIALSQLLESLNFDYVEEPVYQIGNTRGHAQGSANFEEYAALAYRCYHDTYGSASFPPPCIAPEDLHKPLSPHLEPSNDYAADHERRANRARRRGVSYSPPPITRGPPTKTEPIVPGFTSLRRRNVQVGPSTSAEAQAVSEPVTPAARGSTNPWKCPHCPFVQWNRRGPDFRRHVATHTGSRAEKVYLCCGVPLIEAAEHGVPDEVANGEVWEYEGLFMVGGCRRTFSRKDAYLRHLNRQAGKCFGDPQAPYQPGNGASAA
ncbi:hypothetical protein L226DRAFT_616775 [Lentinus tigrinus ALCF2SS1-7]|uniref:Uncharacterized protein n=1 Tax=Lentinus tigrinus ALCF2SS1-6 TaxID=1328759 RepID=A0A5C2SAH2_9APHY|nr:hypothetical protein L227DRAFT_653377 [Lentinus tigrinus ALCF2SS1-6]RPD69533.1 hypothetical protein L226DRAFT_616775 [Lentinus tigrinus ALCF2SS1-7]